MGISHFHAPHWVPPKTERTSPPHLAGHLFQTESQAKGRNVAEGTAHTGFLHLWWQELDFSVCQSDGFHHYGNIFSILYFYTIAQSPEQLETKQLQSYKNVKCFLVHFNDNFLIHVTFLTECNHLLWKTTYLGEKCIVLFLGLSLWSWFYTKRELCRYWNSGHQNLQQCLTVFRN